jgi:hypothetical protein
MALGRDTAFQPAAFTIGVNLAIARQAIGSTEPRDRPSVP